MSMEDLPTTIPVLSSNKLTMLRDQPLGTMQSPSVDSIISPLVLFIPHVSAYFFGVISPCSSSNCIPFTKGYRLEKLLIICQLPSVDLSLTIIISIFSFG